MRQNRRVTAICHRWSFAAAGLAVLVGVALAGCGERDVSPRADRAAPRFDDAPAEGLGWQGVLACADCDGIDTRLRLRRGNGVVAQYELVEAFLVDEGAEYFHEEGRWRRDGRVLSLQASAGGERRYAIDPEGNLMVIDRRGQLAGDGHVLAPVSEAPSL